MKETIRQYLKDNLGIDDEETFTMLYDSFLQTIDDNLVKLEAAISSKNCEEIRCVAHALKGCAANVGAEAFRVACYEIEMAARSGAPESSVSNLNLLKQYRSELISE